MTRLGARGPECPSELELHRLVAGEGAAEPRAARLAHVAACGRCRGRVEALERCEVPAPTAVFWADLTRARARPRRTSALVLALGLASAFGVVALSWRVPRRPEGGAEVRTKGALALDVVVRRASGALDHLAGGGAIAPGETFRFELAHAAGGFPVVVGLDARPAVTLYAPQGSAPLSLVGAGKTLLAEAIVADDAPGPERIIAVLCPSAMPTERVVEEARRALTAAGARPRDVEALALPCAQASVLVEKAAPSP
jgi:hypothetical protein